jgi:hypothetical protein
VLSEWHVSGYGFQATPANGIRRDIEPFVCLTYKALVGNFAGITSNLLALDGGRTARDLRLDTLIPVAGFKRCLDSSNGFGAYAKYSSIRHNRLICVFYCIQRKRHYRKFIA